MAAAAILYNIPRFFEYRRFDIFCPTPDGGRRFAGSMHLFTDVGEDRIFRVVYDNILYFVVMLGGPLVLLAFLNAKLITALKERSRKRREMGGVTTTMTGHNQQQQQQDLTVMDWLIDFVLVLLLLVVVVVLLLFVVLVLFLFLFLLFVLVLVIGFFLLLPPLVPPPPPVLLLLLLLFVLLLAEFSSRISP